MSEKDPKPCLVCHGTRRVPVTEVRGFYEDENRLIYKYRQVVVGWQPCPECKEEKA